MYRNPEGTIPFPKAGDIPIPVWTQPRLPLSWSAGVPVAPGPDLLPFGTVYSASWSSPWYDLRADLRSSQAQPKIGVPIWDRSARLYVEMSGPPGNTGGFYPIGLSASLVEYYETLSLDPGQVPAGAPGTIPSTPNPLGTSSVPVNVSATFFPATPGALFTSLGVFSPPGTTAGGGEGYPVRFWRVVLSFQFFTETNPAVDPPKLNLQAAYY